MTLTIIIRGPVVDLETVMDLHPVNENDMNQYEDLEIVVMNFHFHNEKEDLNLVIYIFSIYSF